MSEQSSTPQSVEKRLRVQHVVVQPVLVWDDGDELTAGPPIDAVALPVSGAISLLMSVPEQVANIEAQVLAAEAEAALAQFQQVLAQVQQPGEPEQPDKPDQTQRPAEEEDFSEHYIEDDDDPVEAAEAGQDGGFEDVAGPIVERASERRTSDRVAYRGEEE